MHNGHDANITVLEDGVILKHLELERYFNKKNFAGVAHNNEIGEVLHDHLLPQLGWKPSDIDIIGFTSMTGWGGNWGATEFGSMILRPYELGEQHIEWEANYRGKKIKCVGVNHHMSHMSAAYYTSPFSEAFVFAYDGEGDHSINTTYGHGLGNKIIHLGDLKDNGIGYTYAMLTQLFLFIKADMLTTAGKAMGLSSYGMPKDEYRSFCRKLIRTYPQTPHNVANIASYFSKPFTDPNDPIAHDLMATIQDECEIYMLETIANLKTSDNVCIGGGCGLNVQINSRIQELGIKVHIPPACSDCGVAMGAALYIWHNILGNEFNGLEYHNPYLGDEVINKHLLDKFELYSDEELYLKVAELLQSGKIVGWIQGRGEAGPRALGNRSIFANPSIANMKDEINQKIKHREFWRPFAPSCLEEEVSNWMDIDHKQPYMLESPMVKEDKRHLIPAVTHVDNTARVQTVNVNQNPKLHRLLQEFFRLTGIPMLLNTSFNDKGFPIINDVAVALDMLKKTDLDCVVVDNYIVLKT
jgi:carbamoyltransferase